MASWPLHDAADARPWHTPILRTTAVWVCVLPPKIVPASGLHSQLSVESCVSEFTMYMPIGVLAETSLSEPDCNIMQGLRGSAQRYVKFLLASTAGYKEPMLHQNGCMDTCPASSQQSRMPAAEELHVHFMSHCEHHMLPFHGQVSQCCKHTNQEKLLGIIFLRAHIFK